MLLDLGSAQSQVKKGLEGERETVWFGRLVFIRSSFLLSDTMSAYFLRGFPCGEDMKSIEFA